METNVEALRDIRRASVSDRLAYAKARRQAAAATDGERLRFVPDKGAATGFDLTRQKGFLTLPPGALTGVDAVVEAGLSVINSFDGGDIPTSRKEHLTTNLLPDEERTLASPFFRVALDAGLLATVSRYLRMVPLLKDVDVWHSRHTAGDARSSQLFHLDSADVSQVKVFVHCTDVDVDSGPLTVLDASLSKKLVRKLDYRLGRSRVSDEEVEAQLGAVERTQLVGPPGTVHLMDTSRCFHFGSRVEPSAPPRTVAVLQFLTPYAFIFSDDWRTDAPYRHLATVDLPDLARLALGGD